MKRRKREYPMGTVSHGTMRNADVIPALCDELAEHAKAHRNTEHKRLVREIRARMDDELLPDYYGSDDAGWDLEALFDALNEYAGPYFYFGAHPGDGSDYGFWLSEDLEREFEGLKVDDMADVPKDYAGEILYVNDHGNTTLYVKARTQEPREVWAVV